MALGQLQGLSLLESSWLDDVVVSSVAALCHCSTGSATCGTGSNGDLMEDEKMISQNLMDQDRITQNDSRDEGL